MQLVDLATRGNDPKFMKKQRLTSLQAFRDVPSRVAVPLQSVYTLVITEILNCCYIPQNREEFLGPGKCTG